MPQALVRLSNEAIPVGTGASGMLEKKLFGAVTCAWMLMLPLAPCRDNQARQSASRGARYYRGRNRILLPSICESLVQLRLAIVSRHAMGTRNTRALLAQAE